MLTLWRRHKSTCKYKGDRYWRKCRCAVHVEGTVEGKYLRQSLKTRSWERGEELKRQLEDGITPKGNGVTVKDALDAFVKDCESRNLGKSTLGKYKRLSVSIESFADGNSLRALREFDAQLVRKFRESWKLSPRTAGKQIERVRQFFKFSVLNGWLLTNPAAALKAPQAKTLPRIPFSDEEVDKILCKAKDDKELAFLLVLRHTGLRIGDASLLKSSQVSGDRIYLYTSKAGTPVSVVIPDNLVSLLKALPTTAGHFFLWGDSTHVHSVSNLWRRRIKAICKDVKIMPDHPHRFRHTLAADLLVKGASVEDVAAILGNSPAVVMKHYSQWIASRQTRLDEVVKKTWETRKLIRVK